VKQDNGLVVFFGLVFGLAVVAGVIWVAWLVRDVLSGVVFVLVGGLVLAVLLAASALPIRAWKRTDGKPIEREHYYHDGTVTKETRILDGRTQGEIKLLQLPPSPQSAGLLTADMLRAAFLAGTLRLPDGRTTTSTGEDEGPEDWDGTVR